MVLIKLIILLVDFPLWYRLTLGVYSILPAIIIVYI